MDRPKKTYIRTLLLERSHWMEEQLLRDAERSGYGDVTPAMSRMFARLPGRPVGLSDLARDLAISRQAVHQLALEGARMGLVEFVPSEADGRVKLLRFTQKGWAMVDTATRRLDRIEAELAEQIGTDNLEALRRLLGRPWTAAEAE
jgi:DNA-binding MarR family transcriptional regulator